MKIFDKIKGLILGIFAVILTFSFSNVVYGSEEVESGIYEVKNSVYHESDVGMSMARSYLDETMQVKITKSEVVFTIGFSGTAYMNNYRIVIDGDEVPVEIVEENSEAGTIKLQVKTSSKDVDMKAKIYVDPMGRDVEFSVIPDYENMTLIEAIEEEPTVEETSNSEETDNNAEDEAVVEEDDNSEVAEKSNNTLTVVVIAAIVIIAIGAMALKFKLKK